MGCANEAARAYTEAILDLLGDEIPIEVLRQTPSKLRVIIEGRADEVLSRPEAPGRWSAVEIIQHLADSEVAWAWRFRLVLSQDRPVLTGYDQDAWAARLKYRDAKVEDALRQFEVLRDSNLRFVADLDDVALARVGVHAERGEESVADMIKLYAGHDLAHLRQLSRVLDAVA